MNYELDGLSWRNLFLLHIACFMLQVMSCSLGGPTTMLRIKLGTKSFLQAHLDYGAHCNLHALHSPAWQEIITDTPSQTQYLRFNSLLHISCYSSSSPSLLLTTSSLCASPHPKPADALWCCEGPARRTLPCLSVALAFASLELCSSCPSLHVAGQQHTRFGECPGKCIPKN